jgi:hypothetical protein
MSANEKATSFHGKGIEGAGISMSRRRVCQGLRTGLGKKRLGVC